MDDTSTPVSIAAIGFGRHFRRSLLPNIVGCEDLRLTAVAELDPDLRSLAADRLGVLVTDSADEILAGPADAILVSAHPDSHVDLTGKALSAGKHVFVEKPLGTDPEQVRHLDALARDAGRVVAVGTMWRHAPAHVLLARWLAERQARVQLLNIAVTFPETIRRQGWNLSPMALAYYDMFIHPIDWARHLLGNVDTVQAITLASTRPDETVASIQLSGPGRDAMAVISAATGSHAYQASAWLHTTNGDLIEVDASDNLRITTRPTWSRTDGSLRDRPRLTWDSGQLYRGWARKGYAEELAAFAAKIQNVRQPTIEEASEQISELEAAARTLDIIHACLQGQREAARIGNP